MYSEWTVGRGVVLGGHGANMYYICDVFGPALLILRYCCTLPYPTLSCSYVAHLKSYYVKPKKKMDSMWHGYDPYDELSEDEYERQAFQNADTEERGDDDEKNDGYS